MLEYASLTNIGGRRVNEDSVGCFNNGKLSCFVVCDGLGGHGMGDAASKLVTEEFGRCLQENIKPADFLNIAYKSAQDKLMEEQKAQNATMKMKTTAVSLLTDGKKAYIGNVGDSRLYVFAKNKLLTRTTDHSVPQMLVLAGEITESEIRSHPDRNLVLRVMGAPWEEPKQELMKPIPMRKCKAFLLCTDGFWEPVTEEVMLETLAQAESPEQWLEMMEKEIIKNCEGKESDNYSAIAIWNK